MMPPGSTASIRPGGHVREDLVELMMIQNVQMHQIIMNNMTMSALNWFGYSSPLSGHAAYRDLVLLQENEPDPEVFHHYYQPAPDPFYPVWLLPQATLIYQDPNTHPSSPPHRDRPAVPPPPPPNTTGTAGADVTPTAGKTNYTSTPSQQPINTVCSRDVIGAPETG
ncbi:proline-rich protein 29-like [Acanthopagrus schlegelii]